MPKRKRGTCLVITGMSGAGKTTVAAALLERLGQQAARMVTTTSRPPREGEIDGVHYHFRTRERFEAEVAAGMFLEYEDNYGKMYGSSAEVLNMMLLQHDWVIAVIDPKGARTYLEKVPGCLTVFLTAPEEQLRRRLKERPGITSGELESRLGMIPEERKLAHLFTHSIVNDDGNFGQTLTDMFRVMGSHRRLDT